MPEPTTQPAHRAFVITMLGGARLGLVCAYLCWVADLLPQVSA